MKLRLLNNGYSLYNEEGNCIFTEETGYESLFQFAHSDINEIHELLDKYMNTMIDFNTLDLISAKPDKELINSISTILKDAHPYFKFRPNETVAEAIADYLLQLVVYRTFGTERDMILRDMFIKEYDKEWFRRRLIPLCSYLFASTEVYDSFEDYVFGKYQDILELKISVNKAQPYAFQKLLLNHSQINQLLYWVLDITIPELSDLTIGERKSLYDTIFPKLVDEPDLEVVRLLSLTNPYSREFSFKELTQKDGNYLPQAVEIYDYARYDKTLSPEAKKLLKSQIRKIKGIGDQALYEEYKINDIFQILFLEIEQMIKNNIPIKKCRYCHKYFVVADKKVEYCSRIAPGETEPCNKIGPARVYKANLEKDYPLKIYERAYGTKYAQYSRSSISVNEFDAWRIEAREKLDAVRAGTLDESTFAQWIEETKKLKKKKKSN